MTGPITTLDLQRLDQCALHQGSSFDAAVTACLAHSERGTRACLAAATASFRSDLVILSVSVVDFTSDLALGGRPIFAMPQA